MIKTTLPILLALLLPACAALPTGPSVAVMPGAGKSFQQFSADDAVCRAYAGHSIGTDINTAGAGNVVTGAAVGTAVGAAAGSLSGGRHATESGAGAGLLMGSAVGAGNAAVVQRDAQRRYDIAYEQCMYAKGHQLPRAPATTTYYGYPRRRVIIYQAPAPAVVLPEHPVPAAPAAVPLPPPPPGS